MVAHYLQWFTCRVFFNFRSVAVFGMGQSLHQTAVKDMFSLKRTQFYKGQKNLILSPLPSLALSPSLWAWAGEGQRWCVIQYTADRRETQRSIPCHGCPRWSCWPILWHWRTQRSSSTGRIDKQCKVNWSNQPTHRPKTETPVPKIQPQRRIRRQSTRWWNKTMQGFIVVLCCV